MNKSGQVIFYGLMLGMCIIILALALAPVLMDTTNSARNETVGDTYGLDCNNESISSFDKVSCYAADLTPFYFIGSLIFIGGIVLISKIIFE
jgi:hypothetical protein